MTLSFEPIHAKDAAAIAALHAASWKVAYRGILTDEYLDTQADSERLAHWTRRLAAEHPNAFGIVARENGEDAGFAWVDLDDDATYGHLLDNLHVRPDRKTRGIGRQLMSHVASAILDRSIRRDLFLWVYEDNHNARRFYDRMLGVAVERNQVTTLDNLQAWQWRYYWSDVSVLRESPL